MCRHIVHMVGVSGGLYFFFFQAEDGIRDATVTGVQTCALPISKGPRSFPHSTVERRAARDRLGGAEPGPPSAVPRWKNGTALWPRSSASRSPPGPHPSLYLGWS